MDHPSIEQLLALAHKHKALHIKSGPIEITLHPSAFDEGMVTSNADSFKMPSEEEMLYLAGADLIKEDEE